MEHKHLPHSPVQRFYRLHACIYDATRWAFLYGRRRAIDALALQPGNTVLEIGCGTGLNFKHILRRLGPLRGNQPDTTAPLSPGASDSPFILPPSSVGSPHSQFSILNSQDSPLPAEISKPEFQVPNGGRLVALDFSEDMLRQARRRTARQGYENVTLLQADATQLSLGEQFDAILFAYSLSMIPDWQAALTQARDHLKPNGRLVLLDFGGFEKWGPLGRAARAWLRLNHVETQRPYLSTLRELFDHLEVDTRLGGYYFVATGSRS